MLTQLRFHGLRHRLGLATCSELRQIADSALEAGIYSPSLVDAALDAEEELWEIGTAFEKALTELGITLPTSQEECCWEILSHHIEQIANKEVEPLKGLEELMKVYRGCQIHEQSKDYVGDSHDIHYLVGAYWGYDELFERPQEITYKELKAEAAFLELDADVINMCKVWLGKHAV
ncbi:MAG: hypothetical protein AAGF66_08050 [Cyanobacteria bacterium P01_H01_bin.119]